MKVRTSTEKCGSAYLNDSELGAHAAPSVMSIVNWPHSSVTPIISTLHLGLNRKSVKQLSSDLRHNTFIKANVKIDV